MTDRLPIIAAKLATALRMMPCRCVEIGAWPAFKAEAALSKGAKHPPKECGRCAALAEYDAYVSIVQVPRVKP